MHGRINVLNARRAHRASFVVAFVITLGFRATALAENSDMSQ